MIEDSENIKRPFDWRRAVKRFGKGTWLLIAGATALLTLLSGYAGLVDPRWWTFPAFLAMVFPVFFICNLLAGLFSLFIDKRLTFAALVAALLTLGSWWTFCPLNVFHPVLNSENADRTLHFMSYNTFGFYDYEGKYPNGTNRTASALTNSGADIICVQEVGFIDDMPSRSLYAAQVDSINDVYPYTAGDETHYVAILSKYPLREIELPQPGKTYIGWQAAEVDFHGHKILVVSAHLQALGLTKEDKLIYHEITEGNKMSDWRSGAKTIYNKLAEAFVERADQTEMLRHQLDSLNYDTVILSGDFNDIPDSYSYRQVRRAGLRSAHADAGFGPAISYHANRFYFNIDHVLYRGPMKAASYRLGRIKSSDHYPVYVDFLFDE